MPPRTRPASPRTIAPVWGGLAFAFGSGQLAPAHADARLDVHARKIGRPAHQRRATPPLLHDRGAHAQEREGREAGLFTRPTYYI